MFFNRNYIPAVPIREEQRLSEEEELARQLKREARIFFPDRKLPDFDTPDLPDLPKDQQEAGRRIRSLDRSRSFRKEDAEDKCRNRVILCRIRKNDQWF